jgi:hypothetical protein
MTMLIQIPVPVYRRLRGYSFDPSLSVQLDTALINEALFKVRWENDLQIGPVGEYLEVIDFDPATNCFYAPVDLNDPYILAQDGLVPSESDPLFHQQMVYSVAMITIQNFEKALGRLALWSPYREVPVERNGKVISTKYFDEFYRRLRIYPHAMRQANAYYSPAKKALLFGYFPSSSTAPGDHIPNGIVFTCLSHDIIAHETTHALLDGMHRRYIEPSQQDTLAFHEAFADIVALFQHFSFPEVLRQQIAKTRGDLASQSLLGQLAQQFGRAIGQYGALRDAIGGVDPKDKKWKPKTPDPNDYQTIEEPHARGAILVAAVFEAFLSIYKFRVADLLRIASNGTGVLTPGDLHPDLVHRLADEAAKAAQHVLTMCIRALDYCPPVDITFGDYLRAIITADIDLVPDDDLGYRVAFIEAFRQRGIYPRDIRTLSEESLCWNEAREDQQQGIFTTVATNLRRYIHELTYLNGYPLNLPYFDVPFPNWQEMGDREKIFHLTKAARRALHFWIVDYKADGLLDDIRKFEETTGLRLLESAGSGSRLVGLQPERGKYSFEVHSFRGARRVGPDGDTVDEVIISITQKRDVPLDKDVTPADYDKVAKFTFRGGCTLIIDLEKLKLKYVIRKSIADEARLNRQREYRTSDAGASLRATYFGTAVTANFEPFAELHSEL